MTERIMGPARLEAFSDGVIAILVIIMVLELKVPASHEPAALLALWPVMLSHLLSFLVIAIYWVDHHGLFHRAREVNNLVLWTNMAFLFCISLIPFATAYMGENRFTPFATALYAGSLLLAGLSCVPMRRAVERQLAHDADYRRVGRRGRDEELDLDCALCGECAARLRAPSHHPGARLHGGRDVFPAQRLARREGLSAHHPAPLRPICATRFSR